MISNGKIYELAHQAGISPYVVRCSDAQYDLPALSWLQDTFADALENFRKTQGVSQFVPEGNDCDDFAKDTEFYARLTYRRSKPNSAASFACGLFSYRQDNGGLLHMINVFVVEPALPRLIWYEPQADRIVQLSNKEIKSCINFSM